MSHNDYVDDNWKPSGRGLGIPDNAGTPGNGGLDLSGGVKVASSLGLKDSGDRRTFTTGAQRDRGKGKGAPNLVPNWVIWLVSRVYEDGAVKYAARNWERGMALSNYIDSAERHLAKLKAGLRDEPHATQVIWNLIGYVFTAYLIKLGHRPADLNDMVDQLTPQAGTPAEPLSPYEYDSLADFFGTKGDK